MHCFRVTTSLMLLAVVLLHLTTNQTHAQTAQVATVDLGDCSVLLSSDLAGIPESVEIDLYDDIGFIETVVLATSDDGSEAIGFSFNELSNTAITGHAYGAESGVFIGSVIIDDDDDEEDELTKCFNENPEPVQRDGESDTDYNARRQQWKNDIKSCMNQHPPRESDGYEPPTGGPVKSGGGWKDKNGKIWKPWNPSQPGHSPHWDRQNPDGSDHENKYPNPPIPKEVHETGNC